MASPHCRSRILSVHLLVSLFFIFQSSSVLMVGADSVPPLVEKICNKTEEYQFCVGTFDNDTRSATADLKGLTTIVFELSLNSAVSTKGYISQLLQHDPPALMKEALLQCGDEYRKGIASLQTALKDLAASAYEEVGLMATLAYANGRTCERVFIEGPLHKSPMTSKNQNLMLLSDISTIASSFLT